MMVIVRAPGRIVGKAEEQHGEDEAGMTGSLEVGAQLETLRTLDQEDLRWDLLSEIPGLNAVFRSDGLAGECGRLESAV